MNEAFSTNVLGRNVSFGIQPYTHGIGKITKCTPRRIETIEFDGRKGHMRATFEVFDLEIEVTEGRHCGGFYCGVPISWKDIKGTTQTITGVGYGQLHDAVWGPVNKGIHGPKQPIVISRCG